MGRELPGRVAGSDLTPALFEAAEEHGGLRVYLLGAGPGVAKRAAARIAARWPSVRVVGTYCPPMGFEREPAENTKILAKINAARPDLLVVGLGEAKKQELWVNEHRDQIHAAVTLSSGRRSTFWPARNGDHPHWMRTLGLEWLHRVACEPRRLLGRYARDAWIFPRLVWNEWAGRATAVRWKRPLERR